MGMQAALIVSYRLASQRIELWQGDALTLPGDLVILGRSRLLREQIEALSARAFEPDVRLTVCDRRLAFLRVDQPCAALPWHLVASLDYRPRRVRIDARYTPPHFTHLDKLICDLWWTMGQALGRLPRAATATLLPLSCRNPEVVAVAQVLAVRSCVLDAMPTGEKASLTFRFIDIHDVSPFRRAIEDHDGIVTSALKAMSSPESVDWAVERWSKHRFLRE